MLNIPETPAKVLGKINYNVDNGKEPSYYFCESEEKVEMSPPGTDVHDLEVQNGWPMVDQLSVDEIGFELREFTDDFRGFHDDQLVVNGFYPQLIDFVKKHTGAKRVVVFDHTIRRKMS